MTRKQQIAFQKMLIVGVVITLVVVEAVWYLLRIQKRQPASIPYLAGTPTFSTRPTTTRIPTLPPIDGDISHWKSYTLKTVRLSFKLPPQISERVGNLQEHSYPGKLGNHFSFYSGEDHDYDFDIAANSSDYVPQGGRSIVFIDYQGYTLKKGIYYTSTEPGRSEEIPPQVLGKEIITSSGVHILEIIGVDYTNADHFNLSYALGKGHFGALINTQSPSYPGINFQMKLPYANSEQIFDQILSTFKFTN